MGEGYTTFYNHLIDMHVKHMLTLAYDNFFLSTGHLHPPLLQILPSSRGTLAGLNFSSRQREQQFGFSSQEYQGLGQSSRGAVGPVFTFDHWQVVDAAGSTTSTNWNTQYENLFFFLSLNWIYCTCHLLVHRLGMKSSKKEINHSCIYETL